MQQLCALFGGAGRSVHNLTLAPNTPMNVSVTQGRAFAAVTLPRRRSRRWARPMGQPSTTWCWRCVRPLCAEERRCHRIAARSHSSARYSVMGASWQAMKP
jgi:hypothetical protein